MNKEEKSKSNKNLVIMGICFLGAFIFIVTSVISYKYGEDRKDKTNEKVQQTQEQIEKQTVKKENVNSTEISSETLEELKANADADPIDTYDEEEATYNPNFKCEGIPEETLALVNNDTDRMNNNIQETLYANGFYSYERAVFEELVEIDYSVETVSISLKVYANQTVNISAIYHRDTDSWETVIW